MKMVKMYMKVETLATFYTFEHIRLSPNGKATN